MIVLEGQILNLVYEFFRGAADDKGNRLGFGY
jgi:hypothetical protein